MSFSYSLICMDTGEMLHLGKLSTLDYKKWSLPPLNYNGQPLESPDDFALSLQALTHFLLRSRGRDIRLLPETVYGGFESDLFPTNTIETTIPYRPRDYDELFALPLGNPGPHNDPDFVPQKVLDRLAELSRGENIEKLPWDEPEKS